MGKLLHTEYKNGLKYEYYEHSENIETEGFHYSLEVTVTDSAPEYINDLNIDSRYDLDGRNIPVSQLTIKKPSGTNENFVINVLNLTGNFDEVTLSGIEVLNNTFSDDEFTLNISNDMKCYSFSGNFTLNIENCTIDVVGNISVKNYSSNNATVTAQHCMLHETPESYPVIMELKGKSKLNASNIGGDTVNLNLSDGSTLTSDTYVSAFNCNVTGGAVLTTDKLYVQSTEDSKTLAENGKINAYYLYAKNVKTTGIGSITVNERLAAKNVEVVDENSTVTAGHSRITDQLAIQDGTYKDLGLKQYWHDDNHLDCPAVKFTGNGTLSLSSKTPLSDVTKVVNPNGTGNIVHR